MPADIIDWSIHDHLEICTIAPHITTDDGEISGAVAIPPGDFVRMFRRDGTGPKLASTIRVRPPNSEGRWQRITGPEMGLKLEAADILLSRSQIERFEQNHDMAPKPIRVPPGPSAKWDWDGFYTAIIRRIHDHGLPEQQESLVNEMLEWFERRSDKGEAPDISTVRKKIRPIWQELREAT
ncbi:MAG TPA: hypothetical protein PKE59_00045 [Novosphingobium sp.]|jgi:hypothetical protein|nr:hypothetical protein [Novosphingobium sp.]